MKNTKPLKELFLEIESLLVNNEIEKTNELLSKYGEDSDFGELRMILVAIKSYKDIPSIKQQHDRILTILETKLGSKIV